MDIKIFYSWQTDSPSAVNKNFIEKALEAAVKRLKKDDQFTLSKILIDRDTKGVPGSPNIPATIDEKIETCNVFIGDLTLINTSANGFIRYFQKKGYRLTPNPNVMIEYGSARKVLGPTAVIGVMNNAYGEAELLPFDIQQNSYPVLYRLKSKGDKNYKPKLNELAKNLEQKIRETVKYGIANPQFKHFPFIDYENWRNDIGVNSLPFVVDDKIQSILDALQMAVKKKNAIIRISGFSGLGKTRLVNEFFKPKNDADIQFRNVLYYNCSLSKENFHEVLYKLIKGNKDSILVLDNCDTTTHNYVKDLINGDTDNNIKLITINPTILESALKSLSDTVDIVIEHEDYKGVIEKILDEYFPGETNRHNRNLIIEFANGHTYIAVALAKNILESNALGIAWQPIVNNKDLLDRLLGDEGKVSENRQVLRACSTFTRFGFFDELEEQCMLIASNKSLLAIPTIPDTNREALVKNVCSKYLKRGILEQQGRYLQARIKPIALSLALEWWEETTTANVLKVFESIENLELKRNFCDQLRYLDFHPDAQEAVEKLCKGPFSEAKVLNTEEGSRLFRSLVEVNPQAAMNALVIAFNGQSTEELKQVVAGRRNLIWSLEKLCFRKETFKDATLLLLRFAIAENENISNNATGQFYHLFQVALPGTEASLYDRMAVLKEIESTGKSEAYIFWVNALIRALSNDRFSRFGDAHEQGTQKLRDYYPSWNEVLDYWSYGLTGTVHAISEEGEISDNALKGLLSKIRGIYVQSLSGRILHALNEVVKIRPDKKLAILRTLKNLHVFDKNRMAKEQKLDLENFMNALQPVSFEEKFDMIVRHPTWESREERNFDYFRLNSESLAESFSQLNWDSTDFKIFYEIHAQEAISFGSKLGKVTGGTKAEGVFFAKSVEAIKALPIQQQSVAIMAGFLRGLKESGRSISEYLKAFRQDSSLKQWAFYLTSAANSNLEDILALFDLVDEERNYIHGFYKFYIDYLSPDDAGYLIEKIRNYIPEGNRIALNLLYKYTYNNPSNWNNSKSLLKEMLKVPGLLVDSEETPLELYQWSDSVLKLLKEESDKEFVTYIIAEIKRACRENFSVMSLEGTLHQLLTVLITEYFEESWPLISEGLISDDYREYSNIDTLFGSHIGPFEDNVGLLFYGNQDLIFDWCVANPDTAPQRIASMVPIFSHNEKEQPTWYPFTKRLIDTFGNDTRVMSNLGANMNTFSWTGSVVPLLKDKEILFRELLNHPIGEVKKWAESNLSYITQEVRSEELNEAEGKF